MANTAPPVPGATNIRAGVLVSGIVAAVFAFGLFTLQPWATFVWPWHDTPLSYRLLAGIAAAIAASSIWVSYSGEIGAAPAGALDLVVFLGGGGITVGVLGATKGDSSLFIYAALWVMVALSFLGFFFWSRRLPVVDQRPMPLPVRASFALFFVILVAVSLALILHTQYVLPWSTTDETSTLFGWLFLGASVYFLYGGIKGRWYDACGQLLGFLAYDLVLIGPLGSRLPTIDSDERVSLIVYIGVLVYSGLLASYFLFVHPATRLWGARAGAAAASR